MQDYINQLDNNLTYISHKIIEDQIEILIHQNHDEAYVKGGYYYRKIKDINYGNKKVILKIRCNRYYETNKSISNKRFSTPLRFVEPRGRMTLRLYNLILLNLSEMAAISAERVLNKTVTSVSDTTILRILKKNNIPLKFPKSNI